MQLTQMLLNRLSCCISNKVNSLPDAKRCAILHPLLVQCIQSEPLNATHPDAAGLSFNRLSCCTRNILNSLHNQSAVRKCIHCKPLRGVLTRMPLGSVNRLSCTSCSMGLPLRRYVLSCGCSTAARKAPAWMVAWLTVGWPRGQGTCTQGRCTQGVGASQVCTQGHCTQGVDLCS